MFVFLLSRLSLSTEEPPAQSADRGSANGEGRGAGAWSQRRRNNGPEAQGALFVVPTRGSVFDTYFLVAAGVVDVRAGPCCGRSRL